MSKTNIAFIFIFFIILLYIRHYYAYPKERQVMQTTLSAFKFDQLLERQPLVIDDQVSSLEELAKMWFPQNLKTYFTTPAESWLRTSHKYTLLMHPTEPMEVLVLHACGRLIGTAPAPDETLTAISLKPNQVLVLPFHTTFLVDKEKGLILGVHDWVTRFLPA